MIPHKHDTSVDLGGLLTVLGKHLYSSPAVAVRELIQNAHDSITRRRVEQPDWAGPGRIQVDSLAGQTVLRIADNGSGLTEDEIHQFLATVGAGYTRTLRDQSDALIGLFGLGFLSAFVIAERVTVTTTSYRTPASTARYQSRDGHTYTVQQVAATNTVGTCIELALTEQYLHLADASVLAQLIGHHCAFLSEPLFFEDRQVNALTPPWRLNNSKVVEHPVQQRKRDLAFAQQFERQFDPICTIAIKPAGSDLRGLLWIQDGGSYASSDNRNLSVFVRGMLLDDDARDLLPRWAGFVGGVIESPSLTPTASREDLQRDSAYQQAENDLQAALVDGLADIAANQKEAWRRILARHNQALLGVALCDDRLFAILADAVRIPTSRGDMRLAELIAHGPVHVSLGQSGGFEDMLYRAMQIPVARGELFGVHSFLRRWAAGRGANLIEIGTEEGNGQLFAAAELAPALLAWLASHLGDGEAVLAARFAPSHLPLVVVPDRDAELRERLESDQADQRISQSALHLARLFTASIKTDVSARLYINLDCPAVAHVLRVYQEQGESPGCIQALALLRAVKIVMLSADAHKLAGQDALPDALRQIGSAIASLAGPAGTA